MTTEIQISNPSVAQDYLDARAQLDKARSALDEVERMAVTRDDIREAVRVRIELGVAYARLAALR